MDNIIELVKESRPTTTNGENITLCLFKNTEKYESDIDIYFLIQVEFRKITVDLGQYENENTARLIFKILTEHITDYVDFTSIKKTNAGIGLKIKIDED